jgi:hypothetical protein
VLYVFVEVCALRQEFVFFVLKVFIEIYAFTRNKTSDPKCFNAEILP